MEYKVSPRPWAIKDINGIDNIIDANGEEVLNFDEYTFATVDAEYVVQCVNEHDTLIAELERLKQESKDWENKYFDCQKSYDAEFKRYESRLAVRDKEIEETKQLSDSFAREIKNLSQDVQQHIEWNEAHIKRIIELSEENKKLKEALRECNPINIVAYADLEAECQFCKGKVTETKKFGEWELNIEHDPNCKYINLCK